jgi:AraC-like DNA-binding protein
MRSKDIDELTAAVSKVYCGHTIRVAGPTSRVDGLLEVTNGPQPLVRLSYGVPVTIEVGNFPDLFLIKHCAHGAASARQDGQTVDWRQGQTVMLSAGRDTELRFDQAFVQKTVRLEFGKLEAACARWLGHPLDRPLQFTLRPFSDALQQVWQQTLDYAWPAETGGLPLSGPAMGSLEDYLLTLLLHQHPHTYSADLAAPATAPVPGIVRRAESYLTEHAATDLSIPDVAAALGVSVRSLQEGFRQWRNTTPKDFLRQTRLRLVHEELLRSDDSTDITSVAMRHGFAHLGRFSGYYHAAFGEHPRVTLRRRRMPTPRREAIGNL